MTNNLLAIQWKSKKTIKCDYYRLLFEYCGISGFMSNREMRIGGEANESKRKNLFKVIAGSDKARKILWRWFASLN